VYLLVLWPRRLTIVQADGELEGRNLEQSNRRPDRFFSALPHHQTSLVALSCGGYSACEGRWSFGSHNVGMLEQLHKMRVLRMNVNSVVAGSLESDEDGRDMVVGPMLIFDAPMNGYVYSASFPRFVDQLPISDAVIMPSFPQRFMVNPWGNGFISNRGIIIGEIDAVVRAFKSRGSQTSGAGSLLAITTKKWRAARAATVRLNLPVLPSGGFISMITLSEIRETSCRIVKMYCQSQGQYIYLLDCGH
jgi:hypothetical protein